MEITIRAVSPDILEISKAHGGNRDLGRKPPSEEGKYNLGWLEEIIDNLYKLPRRTHLSGARPKWMETINPEGTWNAAPEEPDVITSI